MDVDDQLVVIGIAWLAVLSMLVWGGVAESWRWLHRNEIAPFFGMLERRGFTLVQAEEVAGFAGVREAAAGCAPCSAREACRRALRWDRLGFQAPPCPNAAFFARVAGRFS